MRHSFLERVSVGVIHHFLKLKSRPSWSGYHGAGFQKGCCSVACERRSRDYSWNRQRHTLIVPLRFSSTEAPVQSIVPGRPVLAVRSKVLHGTINPRVEASLADIHTICGGGGGGGGVGRRVIRGGGVRGTGIAIGGGGVGCGTSTTGFGVGSVLAVS